jgi:hypothetical protein
MYFSALDFQTRHWHGATKISRTRGGWPIRRLWPGPWRSV